MKKLILVVIILCVGTYAQAQSKGVEIISTGSGKPVLFLPGFSCPGRIWNKTIAQLPAGFRSYTVTYAGFGGVAPIAMPWYESLKKELKDFIVKQNLQNLSIVGHSMGGTLAMDLASELPDRITKLLLVDAIPCIREVMMPGVSPDQIIYDSPYSTQLMKMDDAALKQYALMMAGNMATKKSDIDSLVNYVIISDRKTYVNGFIDLLKLDLRNNLPLIKADVLIMAAPFPTKEIVQHNYENQFASLKKKEIIFPANSKHFIMFDQPTWFYELTNSFLKK
jgi:pimeloyl-ACP methyl ester carboxylesterase